VDEGTFTGGSARLRGVGTTRWKLAADVLGGDGRTTGRVYGDVRRSIGSGLGITLRLKAGAGTEPAMPQTLFRLGGLGTVRGFEYGTLRAPAFWAAQLDITPFGARVRPVIFLDAGQASRISSLFSASALVGGGVGLSLFSGLIRFDLSRPISPDQSGKVRLDLVIQGVR
jgi:hemolysin activation/secretion protein